MEEGGANDQRLTVGKDVKTSRGTRVNDNWDFCILLSP